MMMSKASFRFPPVPLRYLDVKAAQRSLARKDRDGHRDLLLKSIDAFGVGFDS